jgi:hypothetical protein
MTEESASTDTSRFVSAGLDMLELDAGEAELAVIEAVDELYRPVLMALMAAELDTVEPEPGSDMAHAPRSLEQR